MSILILGDFGVGKSTLLAYLRDAMPGAPVTFTEADSGKSTAPSSQSFYGGRMNSSAISRSLFHNASGFIICVSLDAPKSLSSAHDHLATIRVFARHSLPVLVVGLKADLKHQISKAELDKFCHSFGLQYAECSVVARQTSALLRAVAAFKPAPPLRPMPDDSALLFRPPPPIVTRGPPPPIVPRPEHKKSVDSM